MGCARRQLQAGRELRESQNNPPADEKGQREQAPHQATYERLHGVGEGREAKDIEGVSRHAQLEHIKNTWRPLEGHVEFRKAAVLRGAVQAVQAAHGEAPGLQIQTKTQEDLYSRW